MRLTRCVAASVLLVSAAAAPAAAEDPLPAIAQYVEPIPTSSGSTRLQAGDPPRNSPKPQLAAPVEDQLAQEGKSDENALRALVTEPALGAPQTTLRPHHAPEEAASARDALEAESRPSSAAFDAAVGGASERTFQFLILCLLVVTPVMFVS